MFKGTEVKKKKREINLLIDLQINLCLCKISEHYCSLSLQQLLWDTGTKNVPSTQAQNFWKYVNHDGRKDAAEFTLFISS